MSGDATACSMCNGRGVLEHPGVPGNCLEPCHGCRARPIREPPPSKPCHNCGDHAIHRYADKALGETIDLCGICFLRSVGAGWKPRGDGIK